MTRRLVKIAKELNVGTTTIVEHLVERGFEIENKPTAKITDEMYSELLKEYSSSIAVKEKADLLVLGSRMGKPEGEAPAPPPVAKVATPAVPEPPAAEPEPPAEPEEAEKVENIAIADEDKPKLKVLGKIDLDKDKPKKAATEEPEEKVEDEKAAEPAAEQTVTEEPRRS